MRDSPIQHIVIVVQENRSFNNLFATFPGADGTTTGKASYGTIKLSESNLIMPEDLPHNYNAYTISRDGGKMDGFNRVPFGKGQPAGSYPYQYVDPAQIKPYWALAKQYALAEHMFTTQGSSSFVAHQALIRGDTVLAPGEALIDFPTKSDNIWGCDAKAGTVTSLITQADKYEDDKGPFPCFTYSTLRDLLDAKGVTWKYYAPKICCSIYGQLLTAFDAIKVVRYGPEWKTNVSSPQTNIFGDISRDQLANVSWVIPDEPESDHPGDSTDTGPQWVASVGFRVPAIIVSPYARSHYISKTQYEFASILKFIEDNWDLGRLGTRDRAATSIGNCFDFKRSPQKFWRIPTQYSESYFLRQPPSNLPPDTDM
jgi:phospholipase C